MACTGKSECFWDYDENGKNMEETKNIFETPLVLLRNFLILISQIIQNGTYTWMKSQDFSPFLGNINRFFEYDSFNLNNLERFLLFWIIRHYRFLTKIQNILSKNAILSQFRKGSQSFHWNSKMGKIKAYMLAWSVLT